MKQKHILLIIFAIFTLLNSLELISAQGTEIQVLEQNTNGQLRAFCFDEDNLPCNTTTTCQVTVYNPSSVLLVENDSMTNTGYVLNHSLSAKNLSTTGTYTASIACQGSTNGYSTFSFLVTPNGEQPTTALGILYLGLFIIVVILFITSLASISRFKNPYMKLTMGHISYILFVAFLFVVWNLSDSFLPSATFLAGFSFALFRVFISTYFAFVILSIIWLVFEIRKIKAIKNLVEKGIPEDEAHDRVVKKGFRGSKKW